MTSTNHNFNGCVSDSTHDRGLLMITEMENRSASASAQKAFAPGRATRTWDHVVTRGVGANTFRAFSRIDKTLPGASAAFRKYMADSDLVAGTLKVVQTADDLDALSESMRSDILALLHNIAPDRLASYNRTRKVIDLYIVHLVAATRELATERTRLAPLLFLPLDRQTLGRVWGETRSMGSITTRSAYMQKQDDAKRLAHAVTWRLAIPFHRIYLDQFYGMGEAQERRNTPWLNYFLEPRPCREGSNASPAASA